MNFCLETLESRRMLDGDVHVMVRGSDVTIHGDGESNELVVAVISGSIQVLAEDADTLVHGGQTGLTPPELGNLTINLRGGDDYVGIHVQVPGNLRLNAGAGNDECDVNSVYGSLRINLGSGNDQLQASSASQFHGTARVIGGAGADVMVLASTFDPLLVNSGAGADVLTLSAALDSVRAITGGGNDQVIIPDGVHFHDNLVVNTGGGDDHLSITGVNEQTLFLDDAWFLLGGGNDTALVLGAQVIHAPQTLTVFNGGGGSDEFGPANYAVDGLIEVIGFET